MAKSKLARALEAEVQSIRSLRDAMGRTRGSSRSYAHRINQHYGRLFVLLEPTILRLSRRYGLIHLADDARQACRIGIFRAVCEWDAGRASFMTLVHWQMRGELQSLRHRMMPDRRQGARSAGVRVVSMQRNDGTERTELHSIPDEAALSMSESGAGKVMARRCFESLWRRLPTERLSGRNPPEYEKQIIVAHIFGDGVTALPTDMSAEQCRQITRRLTRHLRAVAG